MTDVVETRRHARAVRSNRFDVLLAHASTCAAGLLAARLRVPLAYVFHSPTARELREVRERLPLWPDRLASYGLAPALARFERLAAKHARRILLLSEFSRGLLLAEHPDAAPRVRLVDGGVDVDRFSPGAGVAAARAELGWPAELPLLVTARRLEPRMGLEGLVRAARILNERRPVGLVIVGGGSLQRPLERLVAQSSLGDLVKLVGPVPDEALLTWYRAADLFVLPKLAFEGFGMVTAEALATGTPVRGTPVGATPELLGPLEPQLLAGGTSPEALAGPELRRRCRDHACARFGWDNAIAEWERALEEAAAEPLAEATHRPRRLSGAGNP